MMPKNLACLIVLMALMIGLLPHNVTAQDTDDLLSHKLSERYSGYQGESVTEGSSPYYFEYLAEQTTKGYKDAKSLIGLEMDKGVTDKGEAIPFMNGGFLWNTRDISWAEWSFEVIENGFYDLQIVYTSVDGGTDAPRRAIIIDGEVYFTEMNNLVLDRHWAYDGKPHMNTFGNEVRPNQTEVMDQRNIRMLDSLGRYNEPLKFYLSAGKHNIRMRAIKENVLIHEISFIAPEVTKPYDEVIKDYKDSKQENTEIIRIDAEVPNEKSSISVKIETSTDPKADPSAINGTVYNAIGGPNWSEGNASISWEFEAPESGLYKIAIRVLQKYNDGLSSYRQIQIDGKVPFKELLCYEFDQSDWKTVTLGRSEKDPYLVFLEKGKHSMTMSVKTSPYLDTLMNLEKTLNIYSKVIQEIIMITGIQPDVNFDYRLEKQIPDLMESFQNISKGLNDQISILKNMANTKTSTVSGLEQIRYRVDQMIDNPFVIARMLDYMVSDLTTLSAWISGFNNLALMIDHVDFLPSDADVIDLKSSIFERIWYMIKQFTLSFQNDYTQITSHENSEKKIIDIWISRGKEWAEALNQIIDDEYSGSSVTPVLNMLPAGQAGVSGVVLLALASGTEPDLVIGTDQITPVEFGMRGAVSNLKKFADYDDIKKRFVPGALIPYEFKGEVFGIPETMDFTIMYYREDIMGNLGLKIPDTWDEMTTTILPELKRQGMDFWYEGGLYTFLFQNGGKIYSDDGLSSDLHSPEAKEAFKRFSDLYLVYKVPVAASFFNRFRAGQMPLGISSFATYLQISAAAPELEGKWQVAVIPGIRNENGTINRSTTIATTSIMMFNDHTIENEGWEFIKWYTSEKIQERYANDLISYIGSAAKWFSANTEAFDSLSWDTNLESVIRGQRDFLQGVPNVVGGYITARHIENARVRTVVNGMNFRESLDKAAEDITRELRIKNEQFKSREDKTSGGKDQ
ncbi:MAG: extracellular solute-binding protein [Saccharofermentanales bacterium]